MAKSTQLVVERLEIKPGETTLVYSESDAVRVGEMLTSQALAAGSEATLIIGPPHTGHRQEPPKAITAAMKAADVVICMTRKSITHTNAVVEARQGGTRFGLLIGLDEEYLTRMDITQEDYELMKERVEKYCDFLESAERIRVTSLAGTDIYMSIKGRKPIRGHPLQMVPKGGFAILPDFCECPIAPVEGTAEGRIVCDGWCFGIDELTDEPIRFTVKQGRIIDISGDWQAERLKEIIRRADENSNVICEVSHGFNHKVSKKWTSTVQDKKILGVTHICYGGNTDIGGKNYSTSHLSILFKNSRIYLDDHRLVIDGAIPKL